MATAFSVGGQDLFYLDHETFADPKQNVRGGNPILFPIAGPLQDDHIDFGGKAYQMRQHGFARLLPWQVAERGTDDGAWITLELTANEETRRVYPWEFKLRFTYRLIGSRLTISQVYENGSDVAMPMHIGFHPYFQVADKQRLSLTIPATRYQDTADGGEHPFAGSLDWDQDVIDIVFLDVNERQAAIFDRVRQVGVRLTYDETFKYLVLWSLRDRPFVCLEPWSGRRFTLNSGKDRIEVPARGRVECRIEFEAIPAPSEEPESSR
jgi:galactose mutarotase-like enzyme